MAVVLQQVVKRSGCEESQTVVDGDSEDDNYGSCCEPKRQRIVVFQNRHYLLECSASSLSFQSLQDSIKQLISNHTKWPVDLLEIHRGRRQPTSLEEEEDDDVDEIILVRTISRILGGKGGFGSLLKSQSRQAGARATTDFGMCRDLQGRRLRHVNAAVAAREAREWRQKIKAGEATVLDQAKAAALETSLPGWYLALPAWSDVSKKEHRKWKRQFKTWEQEQKEAKQLAEKQKQQREAQVQHYVQQATVASERVRSSLQSALKQGLAAAVAKNKTNDKQHQKRLQPPQDDNDGDNGETFTLAKRAKTDSQPPDVPTAFVTLSGDVVLAWEQERWQMQSQSNFCTIGMVLDMTKKMKKKKKNDAGEGADADFLYYWEVELVTGGLAQIGWAESSKQFQPSSDTGDGVGDDAASYAYDGSRQICLTRSQSKEYGSVDPWKTGDVVGCCYRPLTGDISFALNGVHLGTAFTVPPHTVLFPAASCNPREILQLHITMSEMRHLPSWSQTVVPVGDLLATEQVVQLTDEANNDDDDDEDREGEEEKESHPIQANTKDAGKPLGGDSEKKSLESATAAVSPELLSTTLTEPTKAAEKKVESNPPRLLDNLDDFNSTAEMEALGLDRLKEALQAIGVKCGGTLQQRAERLFSLKGLRPDEYPPKLLNCKKKK